MKILPRRQNITEEEFNFFSVVFCLGKILKGFMSQTSAGLGRGFQTA